MIWAVFAEIDGAHVAVVLRQHLRPLLSIVVRTFSTHIGHACNSVKEDGVIAPGTGQLGQKVAQKLSGFEVNYLCHDVYESDVMKEKFGAKYVSLDRTWHVGDLTRAGAVYHKL